ncbi:peptidoglycan-binding protein [Bradyrhizobium acaciae]|uniref:peptidoglycan-binding domain-containing protein n=1 Tax=Bradyrhizobium acaciae TaxID=2683706 RepID=UPI001E546525|nr:peptidoglycan-binding domain-containing protein [Bradyrhizobium acaciae]MCC8978672.1 peptidoglycan-binding protein [Bradyrhizobium acaciae]
MTDILECDVRSFQLLKNPFFVLKVDPTTPLDRIAEAVEDALVDAEISEDVIAEAREALINPRQRTSVEVSYLFDSPPNQVARLVAALKGSPAALLKEAEKAAPLSRSNVLTELASRSPASSDILFSILDAQAQTAPANIFTKIQSVRRQAGIVSPSLEAVKEALETLYEQHVKALLGGLKSAKAAAAPLRDCTRRILAQPDEDRLQALERLLRSYAQFASSELGELEEQITATAENLKSKPATNEDVGTLSHYLRKWLELARPLIESEASKGRDDPRSRQLYFTIRNLCLDRANQHDDYISALAISEVASEAFEALPRASEQLAEDDQVLRDRIAERRIVPLKDFIDRVSKWTIAADLESGGFGASSKGEARDLWLLFSTALDELKQTKFADLPWILLRGLAIDLNNEENSPVAAKIIIEELLRLASDVAPSVDLSGRLREDLFAATKNAKEKRLLKLVEGGETSAALGALDDLLKLDLSAEDRAVYNQLKVKLQSQRNGRYVKWGFFGVIGLVLLAATMSNNSGPSSSGSRSSSHPVQPTFPSIPPRADGDNFSSPRIPTPQTDQADASEIKPPIGSGNLLSRSNIRYCRYQKARLKSIEGDLRNPYETDEFNKLADDYNARCSNFRYQESDLRVVEEEVRSKATLLSQDGRRITSAWRSRPSPTTIPGIGSSPPLEARPNGQSPPMVQLPAEIMGAPAAKPEARVQDDSATDLLNLETAIAAQKRLLDLGFFRGPINGVWGPQSRSALKAFKSANGLSPDDSYDVASAERLHSTAALRAAPGAKPSTDPAQESYYAPRAGTSINPLNRNDAARVHNKLRELGYYRATNNNLWSAASRDALKEFKTRNGLAPNDVWDSATEQTLMAATAPNTPSDIEEAFSASVMGAWTTDLRACQGASGGTDALVVTITTKGAETDGARCEFQSFSGSGVNWKVAAVCTVSGETRKTNINLARLNEVLTWSSAKGTTKYLRCPG